MAKKEEYEKLIEKLDEIKTSVDSATVAAATAATGTTVTAVKSIVDWLKGK